MFPHIGRESTFTALGKQWTAARFTAGVWVRVWDWVKPRLPDQFAGLDKLVATMDKEAFAQLVSAAQDRHRGMNSIDCPEARALLETTEGKIVQFMEQLREKHPEVTFDLAAEILEDLGRQRFAEFVAKCHQTHPDAPEELLLRLFLAEGDDATRLAAEVEKFKRVGEGEYPAAPKDSAPAACGSGA